MRGRAATLRPRRPTLVVKRNPDRTREKILHAAFHEIHRYGFRAAAVDRILADTGLTKGALYHHFPNKAALGLAVIDEIVGRWIAETWLEPLEASEDPLKILAEATQPARLAMDLGSPLHNLSQEMSALDDDFREHLAELYRHWRERLAERLRAAQEGGRVRAGIDCDDAAAFLIAAIEGVAGLAKNIRDREFLEGCSRELGRYVESLRPDSQRPA